jgi:hypothetical protein
MGSMGSMECGLPSSPSPTAWTRLADDQVGLSACLHVEHVESEAAPDRVEGGRVEHLHEAAQQGRSAQAAGSGIVRNASGSTAASCPPQALATSGGT